MWRKDTSTVFVSPLPSPYPCLSPLCFVLSLSSLLSYSTLPPLQSPPPILSPFLSLPTSSPLSPLFPPPFLFSPDIFLILSPPLLSPFLYLRPLFILSPPVSSPSLPPLRSPPPLSRSPTSLLIPLFPPFSSFSCTSFHFLFPAFSHSHYLSIFLLIPHATPPSMRLKDIGDCEGMKRSSMYSVYDSLCRRFCRFYFACMSIKEDSRLQGPQKLQILDL